MYLNVQLVYPDQSAAPLHMWVTGTWYTPSGMCTCERPGHTRYQAMNNTWYPGKRVRVVTGYGGGERAVVVGTR